MVKTKSKYFALVVDRAALKLKFGRLLISLKLFLKVKDCTMIYAPKR